MSVLIARGRGALTPSSGLPLAYLTLAHASLAVALVILAIQPDLPGAFFYHPRMIAVVHLLTLGWITASILGSFYVVAPLALGVPMPAGWRDWIGFAASAGGAAGMVSHFWMGTYDGMAWSAGLVLAAIAGVGFRACHGLSASTAPPGVALHIRLAFFNIIAAGGLGILIGLDRSRGFLGLSPLAATYAHAHLATLGWPVMMVMGVAYRLLPMMLPSPMPSGGRLYASAVLLECGLLLLVPSLLFGWPLIGAAGLLILAGLIAFAHQLLRVGLRRLPRPPALPRPDWSVRLVHVAFIWLLAAVPMGFLLARDGAAARPALAWIYGTGALVGFVAQLIAGVQARLFPFQAWYRAMARTGGAPPGFSAHALISPRLARATCLAWIAGVPMLAGGLASGIAPAIRAAALVMMSALALHAWHLAYMLYRASPAASAPAHAHRTFRRFDGRRTAQPARREPRAHGGGA